METIKLLLSRPQVRFAFFVVLALVNVLLIGRCEKPDPNVAQYTKWKATADSVLKVNDSLRAAANKAVVRSDSIGRLNDTLKKDVVRLTTTATSLRKKNDSLRAEIVKTLPDTCKQVLELADSYRAEADTLAAALKKADEVNKNQEVRISELTSGVKFLQAANDSLKKVIINVPQPKDNSKFLGFIPKPTRTTTFLVGAVLGGAAVIAVR